MKTLITADVVRQWRKNPPQAVTDLYDKKHSRLVLRLRPSGTHSYLVRLGRGHWERSDVPTRSPPTKRGRPPMPCSAPSQKRAGAPQ